MQSPEDEVRSTLDPYVPDDPPAELPDAPDFNEYATAEDGTSRPGLARHAVGGHVTASEQYEPSWAAKASEQSYAELINEQVASSGMAAALELAGRQGHGTAEYTSTLEPGYRPEVAYGQDYFAVDKKSANETGGDYMTPQVTDTQWAGVVQAEANRRAHAAAQSVAYGTWIAG